MHLQINDPAKDMPIVPEGGVMNTCRLTDQITTLLAQADPESLANGDLRIVVDDEFYKLMLREQSARADHRLVTTGRVAFSDITLVVGASPEAGPTLLEYVEAGYPVAAYPPRGYAAKPYTDAEYQESVAIEEKRAARRAPEPEEAPTAQAEPQEQANAEPVAPEVVTGDAPEQQPESLFGSSVLPAMVDVGGAEPVQLGTIVANAHTASGLTVEAWNELPEHEREDLLLQEVERLEEAATAPAGG